MMATQPNIEYEAAKFLQKLIQESRDEPAKLATKLYVILQHMKASGKENSMPFQVISRAMETVVNQHGLDIESLRPSRTSTSGGSQIGDCSNSQPAGCPQIDVAPQDCKSSMLENDPLRNDQFSSGRPPFVPNSAALDAHPGSLPHRSAMSFEHESPSSMDTRSANSNDQLANQKDAKRSSSKRKRPDSLGSESHLDNSQQLDMHGGRLINSVEVPGSLLGIESSGKFQASATVSGPYSVVGGFSGASSLDSSSTRATVDHEYWKQGVMRGTVTNFPERQGQGHGLSAGKVEIPVGSQSTTETSMRSAASRDAGKLPMGQTPLSSMPFKDYHLKQLRAQCLVFLAFRNGLMPKRLHLEIALGNNIPKGGTGDGSQREFVETKGKEQANEPANISEAASFQANVSTLRTDRVPPPAPVEGCESDPSGREVDNLLMMRGRSGSSADALVVSEERKQLSPAKHMESEMHGREMSGTSGCSLVQPQPDSSNPRTAYNDHDSENYNMQGDDLNHAASVVGLSKLSRSETTRHAGVGITRELSRGPSHTTEVQQDLAPKIIDTSSHQPQGIVSIPGVKQFDGNSLQRKPIPGVNAEHLSVVPDDANVSLKHVSHEPEEADKSGYVGLPPPKFTTMDKWIMIQQKKRRASEDKWTEKHEQVDQRIAERFIKLKETVSSSDDISAKTRSVIELKKLQLLQLQRRLRSNIMNDFFKSITMEVDRLKSIKKHRIGRRLKHVEKYEQRMKEERQRRIRERQKEFFSEVELHKEILDDVFKYKKERWRGFNRYVKEFHKRKERLHREKIDRIQREKINLLKINDVEGYLRMVQDAKSDRVKQLLKETEKYLQKLGAKLQEAKSLSKHFENEMDGIQTADGVENNEYFGETEDENDQAKHYKESNEKYYLIAHSIKEIITEQPTGLQGGKLREYQMNGLRWLVSLYNNHLNGILADEMGLGKTVQVISLICYLMETKNDRGPFLVVVPSSVLPGWDSEINSWAPGVNKIVYAGPPEERRRLFKECIVHQKFNVLLTTYEYLMNKHDRPKLSKIHWHYVIIDEGHRIKNASCKLNADLKHYQSSHRLLLTGTPLQNNLEELWALLNFLLPNIFNSSEDFSQWFNKPFESNGDNSPDEALLSEEENLLIINRLHQVLRPFVLRRLKHKVENELPEKIERLVRCEASAYQKLLMKRVEENLGSLVNSKARSIHNSVMELRNICNHPYLSQLHVEEVETLIPKHFLPPIVRLCGKLEMLDRLLPKLKATSHRVLFFSTMTRLLDVMEDYLIWKQYRYLRLDGHTSGNDRGALIDQFNHPDSPYFIFLLSIRAGGVGVNLQAADTVIIFDTDWNPQVDLQAQARAHRIGQKKEVLVLRLETVNTVEEQVRASAEHKLGVANQSITAGFFDNNTSAEDRREYLESLLRESKKEEAAPVLEDDSLNDLLARSESEIDVFESIDQKRQEDEMATWKRLVEEQGLNITDDMPALPNRLVSDEDLKEFYEAMRVYEVAASDSTSNAGMKRKGGTGSYDTQHYGRGKRAREVRSYEEQWTEEEFEKMCQAEFLETHKSKEQMVDLLHTESSIVGGYTETPSSHQQPLPTSPNIPVLIKNEVTPPVKRGRGRPRRIPLTASSTMITSVGAAMQDSSSRKESIISLPLTSNVVSTIVAQDSGETISQNHDGIAPQPDTASPAYSVEPGEKTALLVPPVSLGRGRGSGRRGRGRGEAGGMSRGRGRRPGRPSSSGSATPHSMHLEQSLKLSAPDTNIASTGLASEVVSPATVSHHQNNVDAPCSAATSSINSNTGAIVVDVEPNTLLIAPLDPASQTLTFPSGNSPSKGQARMSQSGSVVSANVETSTVFAAIPGSCDLSILGKTLPPSTGFVHSTTAATSTLAVPVSVSSMSTLSDVAPSKRRGRKPQGSAESAQRRGRKQSLATSSVNTLPSAHDPVSSQPVKYTEASFLQAPAIVQYPQGSAGISVESEVVSVPMCPVVVVSGVGSDFAAVNGAGGVVQDASVVPVSVIPSPSPPGSQGISSSQSDFPHCPSSSINKGHNLNITERETSLRRRGRKKIDPVASASPSSTVQGKNPSDAKGTLESLVKKDSAISSQVHISQVVKQQTAKSDVSSLDASLKSQQVLSSPVDEPKQIDLGGCSVGKHMVEGKLSEAISGIPAKTIASSTVAECSPTRSKAEYQTSQGGKVTTIVLALKTSSSIGDLPDSVDIGEEKCSEVQQGESALEEVLFDQHGVCQAKTNVGLNPGAADQLDEDISAPPGFESKLSVGSEKNLTVPGQILDEDSSPPGFGATNVSSPEAKAIRSAQIDHAETSVCRSLVQAVLQKFPSQLSAGSEEKKEDSGDLARKDSVPSGFGIIQTPVADDKDQEAIPNDAGVISGENEALRRSNHGEPDKNQFLNDKPSRSGATPLTESMDVDAIMDKNGKEAADNDSLIAEEKKDLVLREASITDMVVSAGEREPSSSASDHMTFPHKGGGILQVDVMKKDVPHATVSDCSINKGMDIVLETAACEHKNTQNVSMLDKPSQFVQPSTDVSSSNFIRTTEGTTIHDQGEDCEDNRPHDFDGPPSSIGNGAVVPCTLLTEGDGADKASLAQNVAGTADLSFGNSCNVVESQVAGDMSMKVDAQIGQHTNTDKTQTSVGCISSNAPVVSKDDDKHRGAAAADVDTEILELKGSIDKASSSTRLAEKLQATLESPNTIVDLKVSNDPSKDAEDSSFVKDINVATPSSLGLEAHSALVYSTLSSNDGEEQNESREIAEKGVGPLIVMEKDDSSGNLLEDCRNMANILNSLGREISLCLTKESTTKNVEKYVESVSKVENAEPVSGGGGCINDDKLKKTVARAELSNVEDEIVQPLAEMSSTSNRSPGENVGELAPPIKNIEIGEVPSANKNMEIVAEPGKHILNSEKEINNPSLEGSQGQECLEGEAGFQELCDKDSITSNMDIDESELIVGSIKVSDTAAVCIHETCRDGDVASTSSKDNVDKNIELGCEIEMMGPPSTFSECRKDELLKEKQCDADDTGSAFSEAADSKTDTTVMMPDKGENEGADVRRRETEYGMTDDIDKSLVASHTQAEPVVSCKVEESQGDDVFVEGGHSQSLNDDIPCICSEASDAQTGSGTAPVVEESQVSETEVLWSKSRPEAPLTSSFGDSRDGTCSVQSPKHRGASGDLNLHADLELTCSTGANSGLHKLESSSLETMLELDIGDPNDSVLTLTSNAFSLKADDKDAMDGGLATDTRAPNDEEDHPWSPEIEEDCQEGSQMTATFDVEGLKEDLNHPPMDENISEPRETDPSSSLEGLTNDAVVYPVPELTGTSGNVRLRVVTQKPTVGAHEILSSVDVAGIPQVDHIDGKESRLENSRPSVQKMISPTDDSVAANETNKNEEATTWGVVDDEYVKDGSDPEILPDANAAGSRDEIAFSNEAQGQKEGKRQEICCELEESVAAPEVIEVTKDKIAPEGVKAGILHAEVEEQSELKVDSSGALDNEKRGNKTDEWSLPTLNPSTHKHENAEAPTVSIVGSSIADDEAPSEAPNTHRSGNV